MTNCNKQCGECPSCIVKSLEEGTISLINKMKELKELFKMLKGDKKNV